MISSSRRDVVVVGAAGVLGRILCAHFGARGVDLRHPDAVLTGHIPELASTSVVVDVSGPRVRPGLGWSDYLREHVGTSSAVARAMRPGAHLVHVSSASVYGSRAGVLEPADAEAPILFPNPSYAWSKLAGEYAARAIAAERGVRLSVVRLPVVYGPGVESAIDTMLRLAKRGISLELRPPSMRQHLLHVHLLLAALERMIDEGPLTWSPSVVADPFVLTNAELVGAVERRFAPKIRTPVPLRAANRLLRSWPGFPERDAPMKLAAFGVLALDTAFDWRPAFQALGLDPETFGKERMFDAYVEGWQ